MWVGTYIMFINEQVCVKQNVNMCVFNTTHEKVWFQYIKSRICENLQDPPQRNKTVAHLPILSTPSLPCRGSSSRSCIVVLDFVLALKSSQTLLLLLLLLREKNDSVKNIWDLGFRIYIIPKYICLFGIWDCYPKIHMPFWDLGFGIWDLGSQTAYFFLGFGIDIPNYICLIGIWDSKLSDASAIERAWSKI